MDLNARALVNLSVTPCLIVEVVRLGVALALVAASASAGASAPSKEESTPPPTGSPGACMLFLDEGGLAWHYEFTTWPDGLVYYTFDAAVSAANANRVLNAMIELECVCGVQFLPWPGPSTPNYIVVENSLIPGFNYSTSIGMKGGEQTIAIVDWTSHYIIIHEIMHALGFQHEHQKSDRDDYVTVQTSNVDAEYLSQFDILEGGGASRAYDFDSVMHYSACAFSNCGQCDPTDPGCATIVVNQPWHAAWQELIGNRNHLSAGDVTALRFLYPSPGSQDPSVLPVKIYEAPFKYESDLFGYSIDTKPGIDRAIIGVPQQDPFATDDRAYIMSVPSGVHLRVLQANNLAWGARFGVSVAIDDGPPKQGTWHAVVGAEPYAGFATNDLGSAYVFDAVNGGDFLHQLVPWDGEYGKLFGHSVGIHQGQVVVGSPYAVFDAIPFVDWGAAYVFSVSGAGAVNGAKLLPSDTANEYTGFGFSVDIHNGVAIVGSPEDDHAGFASGSAYLFDAVTGAQLFKLTANDSHMGQNFGVAVVIQGDLAIVGALGDNENGTQSGAVYVFNVSSGALLAKLTPSNAAPGHQFGRSVAISGHIVMVGATGSDPGSPSGAAYFFDFVPKSPNYGQQIDRLDVCMQPQFGDQLGFEVALNERIAMAGAPYRDSRDLVGNPPVEVDTGAIFAFTSLPEAGDPSSPMPGDFDGDGFVNGNDLGTLLGAWGSAAGDLNDDGTTDGNDLGVLLGNWTG